MLKIFDRFKSLQPSFDCSEGATLVMMECLLKFFAQNAHTVELLDNKHWWDPPGPEIVLYVKVSLIERVSFIQRFLIIERFHCN